eukprot:maker-scaffold430_size173499-snap-gene-0.40 protein:Tk06988 transcript:maker-scaffold430_size173499-snap-gene-0.40-mRNA-1 annotation:"filamin-a isoform x3"
MSKSSGRKTLPRSTHLSGADASLKARGAVAGGSDSIDKDSEEESIRHGSARDPAVEKLQAQDKAAFDYLARRGSEADKTGDTEEEFDHEAMANAERDLAEDAEWKRIQKNTFTRWANEHLKQANKSIDNLETDLSDGLRLISLIEVLSGKRMPRHNKKPVFRSQKLENVSIALNFLEMEGITLVNIDSTDIVDCKLKLILGLIWTLILHYAISMPMWDGPALGGGAEDKTPKQRLMGWVKDKLPDVPMHNFTKDWQDGKAIGALVDSVAPGLCPDWDDWDPTRPVDNATEAMDLADKWLNVPKLLRPEEMVDPNVDEQSMMTYLSQFPNAKVKPGAPLRKKTNVAKVRAFGPGLEPRGLVAKAPAKFTVETFGAGDGEVRVEVVGPDGQLIPCEALYNNDRKKTYSCKYFPEEEGDYVVKVYFASREIPKSPYNVCVEGFAGDASVVTASGPGIEPEGVILNKSTYFHIYAQDAGRGTPEVIVLDPKGKKDSVPVKISETDEKDVYKCEYVATTLGLHSVNVFFAGNPIPKSPFGVRVSPSSLPAKVWTSGKGLQPNGIRVNETVSFKVHTEGAGEGEVAVKILGPGGLPIRATSKKIDDFTTEYTYTPIKQGRHIVMITFANQEIPRSPFEVNISADKTTSIKAYGPGLKGGIVNRPARFTVDTNGEAGGLGFSIKGPSQAQINCSDNGDGSADVDYIPTAVGEYAVHILNDDEDIPGSPFMANILPETDFYPERVKVFGPGVENGVNPKETTYFTIDITDAGDAPLDVSILDDLGQFEPKIVEEAKGIFKCTYQPRKKQHKQTVMVNFGGVAVPGSPFRVQNDNPNDPSLVKVFGPGVEDGVQARKPTDFTVDCRKSGPGDLQVNIESKSRKKVPITMKDNKDGTQTVTYEPTEPGSQTITITLDGKEVPQSPIALKIKPGLDLNKIKLKDFETEVFVDCTNEFEVDASDLPPNHTAKVECYINGPSGEPLDCFVNKVEPNGPFNVSYVPKEEGEHDIHLKYEGQTLPDSPLPVVAMHGCDPTRVQAYGDGLEQGIVDEPNEFTIDTKNAGAGGLGLAIEGPSEAVMTCNDNKDGTATVEYVPTEEGDYDVAVRFGDDHIPGSPFKVPAVSRDGKGKGRGNPDSSKVTAYGPGLEPGNVFPGKPTEFIVDASETSDAPVKVEIRDASGKLVPKRPVIAKKPSGIHEVSYVPPPVGEPYEIAVKYNGENIPDSPFLMSSNPNLEEFIDDPEALASLGGSRKSSRDPENQDYAYSKNGTGVQRKSSRALEDQDLDTIAAQDQADIAEIMEILMMLFRIRTNPEKRQELKMRPKEAQYLALGRLVDEFGRPIDAREPQFRRNSRGQPVDDQGRSLPVDGKGRPIDQAGRPVDEFGRPIDEYGRAIDNRGNPIPHSSNSSNSNQIPEARQPKFRQDSRGNLIGADGQALPLDKYGRPIDDQGRLIDELGRPIDAREPQFRKNSRGQPVDEQGLPLALDKQSRPLDEAESRKPSFKEASSGNPVDEFGRPLQCDKFGRPIDDQGRHIDEFGRPINSRAPNFKKNSQGSPLDENGQPQPLDKFGRPVDTTGQLVDEFGRPIDEYGRPLDSRRTSMSGDGRPIQGRVPNFKKNSRGNLLSKSGNPLPLDGFGRPIDEHGRPIDEFGAPIDSREPVFKKDSIGKPVNDYGLHLPVDALGRPVDANDRLIDEFGRLIDEYGRPIDHSGCLLDHSGRPLDASGKPFGGKHGGPGGRRSSSARALLPEGSSSGDSLSGPDSLGSAPGSGRFGDRKPLGSSHPYDSSGFSSRKTSVLDDSTHPYGKPSNPGSRKSSDISQTQGSSFYSSSRKSSDIDHPYESMSKPGVRKGSDMGGAHNRPQAGLRNIDHPRSNTHDPSLISVADPRRISPSDNSHDNNGNSRGNYGSRPGSSQDQILAKGPHDSQTIPGRDAFSPDTLDRKGHSPYGSRSGSRNDLLPGFNQPNTIPPGGESLNNPSGSPPGGSRQSSRSNMYGNGGLPGRPSNSGQDYSPLELSNIPLPSARGDVETVVRTPSGNIAYPYVEDNGNGSIGVSYQPTERGPHSLDVKHDGEHIQGSPYKFYSSPMEDGQVHAFGPGLAHAVCGDPADFVISTKGAGAGGLALAVEGPSKAEINCNDNKDGTVNVSYLPTAPGEYKISAKFADKHIEGSPFTCKVTGEGKKRNAISVGSSSELSLPDNLSDYDLRALDAYIISPSGNEEPCFLKKLPQGNTGISFTPKETGEHLVSVKRNEKHIKNSPFKIVVKPDDVGDASRVKVTGKALSEGKTQEDNTFHIDTKKAGYGGLSLSVEGPSKAEIKCNDHEDGSLDVSYCPTQPGLYIINLKFADQHVPGSPFAAAVSGLGQESKHERINHLREAVPVTEVGSQCRLTFKMPGINARDLETDVRSPSGKINKAAITEIEDGLYAVNFVPYELGIHTVSVQYHDLDIPGSPFQFTVGPLQDGGAHRVHAGGSGLERGVQGQPTDFNVWTREAGHGSLAISVEGPSKAVVDFKDRKDGSCHVSYTVEEPGEYTVGIRFNDQHIPGSPYKAYIQPASDEADRIRLSNIADHPVKPDTPQTMLLNMNGADGDVECRIVAPSGREDDCFITPLGSGEHTVRFVPKEEGVHYLHARFNGVHIPGSPFKIIVGNLNNNDPSTVSVAGRGIESGITGEKSMFVIDTSSVGAGTLSITVDGPSKVDLACHEVDHGYEVSYTPMVPGKYYVTVKYNGKNIAGSPFSVHISGEHLGDALSRQRKSSRSSMTMETLKRTSYIRHQYTESRTASSQSFSRSSTVPLQHQTSSSRLLGAPLPADASKVRCAGSGLMNAKTLRHNSFQVDGSQAGDNVLFVGIWGPDVPCEEVVIKHQGNKKYSVDYYVKDKGKYIVYVKWGDDHIPGSPFHIEAR